MQMNNNRLHMCYHKDYIPPPVHGVQFGHKSSIPEGRLRISRLWVRIPPGALVLYHQNLSVFTLLSEDMTHCADNIGKFAKKNLPDSSG